MVNKAGIGVYGSSAGLIADSQISDNANNIIIKSGARNVTLETITGCSRAFIYGFCGDPSAYTIKDNSCPNTMDYNACVFPEAF